MASYTKRLLAPAGSTGSNTHAGVASGMANAQVAFQLNIEAIGSTPQITWLVSGSHDDLTYFPVPYVTDATDTAAVIALVVNPTVVGASKTVFASNPQARTYRFYRVVTSANTNTTYNVAMFSYEGDNGY